jgi:hypothetical protein
MRPELASRGPFQHLAVLTVNRPLTYHLSNQNQTIQRDIVIPIKEAPQLDHFWWLPKFLLDVPLGDNRAGILRVYSRCPVILVI